jgi:hypothetical protein
MVICQIAIVTVMPRKAVLSCLRQPQANVAIGPLPLQAAIDLLDSRRLVHCVFPQCTQDRVD